MATIHATDEERIQPITITDKKNGKTYTLDFDRDSVAFAEERGFELENVARFPVVNLPLLFFYAFRMHNREMSYYKTNELYKRLGGLSKNAIERLSLLYQQAQQSNVIVLDDEDMGKNGDLTVDF